MVSLAISSLLVVLIGTVFLVQSQVYGRQVQRSSAHDNARMLTEVVGSELRTSVPGGLVIARSDSFTVRTPMVVAAVCGATGSYAYAQMDGGIGRLDPSEVAGFGVFDDASGAWTFYGAGWSAISGGTTDAATTCFNNGADTVGARDDFVRLANLDVYHGSIPPEGSVLMLYRQTTFRFRASAMDSGSVALYRRASGGSAQEYVTGLDTTAAFAYRLRARSGFRAQVSGEQLLDVDAVRIVAETRQESVSGSLEDFRYGWTVTIPLRNAR